METAASQPLSPHGEVSRQTPEAFAQRTVLGNLAVEVNLKRKTATTRGMRFSCYGQCRFASSAGELTGSHFLTVIEGAARLAELGKDVVWKRERGHSIRALGRMVPLTA